MVSMDGELWFDKKVHWRSSILNTDQCPSGNYNIIITLSISLASFRILALNRSYNNRERCLMNSKLYSANIQFMNEYLSLGSIRTKNILEKYFILNHVVVKHNNWKFKINVVFLTFRKNFYREVLKRLFGNRY